MHLLYCLYWIDNIWIHCVSVCGWALHMHMYGSRAEIKVKPSQKIIQLLQLWFSKIERNHSADCRINCLYYAQKQLW